MSQSPVTSITEDLVAEIIFDLGISLEHADSEEGEKTWKVHPTLLRELLKERASLLAHITRLQNGVADDYAEVERMHGEYMVQWRNARKLRAELRELRDSMTFRTSLIGRLEEDRDKWKALAESKAAK